MTLRKLLTILYEIKHTNYFIEAEVGNLIGVIEEYLKVEEEEKDAKY